jgi:NTP pyrophosphatase (non-canonical NTP hydrolase)
MVSNKELDSPINAYQQLLAITAEECGELTQVCMKIMRKYDNLEASSKDKYRDLLVEEAGDVLCMLQLMVVHKLISEEELVNRSAIKMEKLKIWSDLV